MLASDVVIRIATGKSILIAGGVFMMHVLLKISPDYKRDYANRVMILVHASINASYSSEMLDCCVRTNPLQQNLMLIRQTMQMKSSF